MALLVDKYPNNITGVDEVALEDANSRIKYLVDEGRLPNLVEYIDQSLIEAKNTIYDGIKFNWYPTAANARGVSTDFDAAKVIANEVFYNMHKYLATSIFFNKIAAFKAENDRDWQQHEITNSAYDRAKNEVFSNPGQGFYDWDSNSTIDSSDNITVSTGAIISPIIR